MCARVSGCALPQWHNHDKSLKLEEELLQQLNEKIAAKVSEGQSSWIDWQYIVDAAKHLTKVRGGRGRGQLCHHLKSHVCPLCAVPVHPQVHLPLCLLHGGGTKENTCRLYGCVCCACAMC